MRIRRALPFALAVALATFTLAACGGGGSSNGGPATSPGETETGESAPPTELHLSAPVGASTGGYAEPTLTAPADTPFTIAFQNDDEGIPHNVMIWSGTDLTADPVFAPENNALITGPESVTYEVDALPAGTYTFACFVHQATMKGTLTVQ